jgi:hypothetical protein
LYKGTVHGVAVYGAVCKVFVYDCVSEGAQVAGFWAQDGAELHVEGELFCLSDSEWAGCGIRGAHTRLVAHNLTVRSCQSNGVIALQGAQASLHHCRVESCRMHGVHVFDQSMVSLHHCVLQNAQKSGAFVTTGGDLKAEFCEIRGEENKSRGVQRCSGNAVVAKGSGSVALLYACKLSGNFELGVLADGGGKVHCLCCVSSLPQCRDKVIQGILRLENSVIEEAGGYEVSCRGRSSVVVRKAGWLLKVDADALEQHRNPLQDACVAGVSFHSSMLGCVVADMLVAGSDSERLSLMVRDYESNVSKYAEEMLCTVSMMQERL